MGTIAMKVMKPYQFAIAELVVLLVLFGLFFKNDYVFTSPYWS